MLKLTDVQWKAVQTLAQYPDGECTYTTKIRPGTLEALMKRKLVVCVNPGALGSLFSPQTTLKYKLTSAGLTLVMLAQAKEREARS